MHVFPFGEEGEGEEREEGIKIQYLSIPIYKDYIGMTRDGQGDRQSLKSLDQTIFL